MAFYFLFCLLFGVWSLIADAGDPGISVIPPYNQTVAITSNENITYECAVDDGRSAFWSVLNNPLEGDHTVSQFESIGIYKQDSPQGNSSVLIVSQMGREAYRNTSQDIKIRCRAFKESPPESAFSDSFYIIPYDRPESPLNLMLTTIDGNITLTWSRPLNIPQSVSVTYIVEQTSITRPNVTHDQVNTSMTFAILHEDDVMECDTFNFVVTASNEAGVSTPSRIRETIPISPDVSSTSTSLSIDAVQIVNQNVSIAVSFKPASTCNENFTVSNYSVNLIGFGGVTFTPSSGQLIFALLNSSKVDGLIPDSKYNITVTACIEIACRESEARQVYTTDVQNATVMFVGTRILLTCTFANISSAKGCIIKFTLSNNLFEQFNITRSEAQLCSQTDSQITAYDRVEAFDWEADGSEGTLPIHIQPLEALDEQHFTMSCPGTSLLRISQVFHVKTAEPLSAGVVAVITVAAVLFVVIIVIIVLIILTKICHQYQDAIKLPPEDNQITLLKFDEYTDATKKTEGDQTLQTRSGQSSQTVGDQLLENVSNQPVQTGSDQPKQNGSDQPLEKERSQACSSPRITTDSDAWVESDQRSERNTRRTKKCETVVKLTGDPKDMKVKVKNTKYKPKPSLVKWSKKEHDSKTEYTILVEH